MTDLLQSKGQAVTGFTASLLSAQQQQQPVKMSPYEMQQMQQAAQQGDHDAMHRTMDLD